MAYLIPLTRLVELLAMIVLPLLAPYTSGVMNSKTRHGRASGWALAMLLVCCLLFCSERVEQRNTTTLAWPLPHSSMTRPNNNMAGMEVRLMLWNGRRCVSLPAALG
ncbi:potassium-transporting ATPase subunit KdpA [Ktedonobacter sp. SOSP1-85]|uniref:potassium-transporting ATPase subunit KdpA n=1 Tax=Ktedonobacter sp. SOSP1-85 TaxID=2778367 RepID=UPI0019152E8F